MISSLFMIGATMAGIVVGFILGRLG